MRAVDEELYTLTAMQSRWIGAELHDVDLYLELARAGRRGSDRGLD